jgi:hypothetical protein
MKTYKMYSEETKQLNAMEKWISDNTITDDALILNAMCMPKSLLSYGKFK